MKASMIISNVTQNSIIASDAALADNFISRLKGLLGTDKLDTGKALIIFPCNSIHTFGMKYPIDVVFLDNHDKVVKINEAMPVNRFALCSKSNYVIELPAGTIEATGTVVGDKISLKSYSKI